MTTDLDITDNLAENRYEVRVGDELLGLAEYELEENRIIVVHSEVKPAAQGKGVGGRLARHILDDVRTRNLSVLPECPFIAHYIDTHPEYADLVDASF